jgi:protein involved in polysaccharide export with SLBB domain
VQFSISAIAATGENPNTKVFDEGLPLDTNKTVRPRPYGADPFSGKFQSQRDDGLDPDYRIAPGDKIKLHLWGVLETNEVVTVDANGKLFIPDIGAVKVAGTRSADLPSVVRKKIKTVYEDGVESYVTVLTATPVSVFVTGPVLKPGQYSGVPSDSVLTFLHQAGGIHPDRGSYRKIRIMRGRQTIAQIDLYEFLRWGKLKRLHFKDGDTIIVDPQGATVNVFGDVRNPFRFEFRRKSAPGQELAKFARPFQSVTNAAVSGTRKNQPFSAYLPYKRFLGTPLFDGDTIRFVSDAQATMIDITIEGSHLGNTYYAVKKGSKLKELLDYVAVDPNDADIGNIYIKRKKIAAQQKKNLEMSLRRLERSVLTAPAQSDGEASIRAKEADLVLKFIANARKTQPEGRVIVSERGKVSNIRLEDGDVIVIPPLSDVITVNGEVQIPQAIVYANNATVTDYIARSGGFTERADSERIALIKPNGKVEMGKTIRPTAGDQIIVFPKIDTKNMQFAKDLTQIIYQVAVGASIAVK